MKEILIENIIKKIKRNLIIERKSDELSLGLSRLVINQFKIKEDFELENIHFERGDEYANFDFFCYFIEDKEMDDPFSIRGSGDMQEIEIEITYNPDAFPKSMNDLVAEVKETIEHELEHVEQQNFNDMYVKNDEEYDEEPRGPSPLMWGVLGAIALLLIVMSSSSPIAPRLVVVFVVVAGSRRVPSRIASRISCVASLCCVTPSSSPTACHRRVVVVASRRVASHLVSSCLVWS